MLTEADVLQIREERRSLAAVEEAVRVLSEPVRWVGVRRPATCGDGIRPPAAGGDALVDAAVREGRVSSFIPASGASTRLAASLTAEALARYPHIATALDALDASRLPKALLPVHAYPRGPRTALEEHLREAAALTADATGLVRVHFTVGQAEVSLFEAALAEITARLPHRYEVGLSVQSPLTDMPYLRGGQLARVEDGRLAWRPGGHGALLHNLAALAGDLVLIKNIDNVVVDRERPPIVAARRGLLATLLWVQAALRQAREEGPEAVVAWFLEVLGERVDDPALALARPIRVCGMVPNSGAPGGGPFWTDGGLQIVEGVEIDPADERSQIALRASTHFNPVDLAVSLRDLDGHPIALMDFQDTARRLRATKQVDGKPVSIVEHPGLWNGSMQHWTTLFVELPACTFAPVKTVADLESASHRP